MIGTRTAWAAAAILALAACQRSPAPESPDAAPAPAAAPFVPAPGGASAGAAPAESEQAFVLPGDFAASTTQADLERRFGKEQVRIGQVPGGEGETSRGIVLFPDDAQRRAYLYFQDEKALTGLSTVRIVDAGSRWSLANGLKIGMPLKDVVVLNGKPIAYYGLGWDYGGSVTSLNGGKLETTADAKARPNIRLGSRDVPGQPAPDNAYPVGDREFSSDDPKYPKQGEFVAVSEIAVSFPGKSAE